MYSNGNWWMAHKKTLYSFLRVNNRKKHHTILDFIAAGYPTVELTNVGKWSEIHKLCTEIFITKQGIRTFTWFGDVFVFQNEDDADVFRSLQYMV